MFLWFREFWNENKNEHQRHIIENEISPMLISANIGYMGLMYRYVVFMPEVAITYPYPNFSSHIAQLQCK